MNLLGVNLTAVHKSYERNIMDWKLLCSGLQDEDSRRSETQILIRLGNGLTISGLLEFEAAKIIFRDPSDLTMPLKGDVCGQRAVVVLPPGIVQQVAFPHIPT